MHIVNRCNLWILTSYLDILPGAMSIKFLSKSLSVPQSSIVLNFLWLFFATTFIWFPYIGMISIPCQKGSTSTKFPPPWSQRDKRDYTGIGKLLTGGIWFKNHPNFPTAVPLSVGNHSFIEVMKV